MRVEGLAAVLESCHGQAVNPDISGIGVRLSFYLQNFLLGEAFAFNGLLEFLFTNLAVILVDRSWQDATGALWTFITTSFGLTLSAMIQAKQGQLSLFQALTVGNLVWCAVKLFGKHTASPRKYSQARLLWYFVGSRLIFEA